MRRSRLAVGGMVLVVITLLVLGGCGGSGGASGGGSAASSIRVVFPGQQASLGQLDSPPLAPLPPHSPRSTLVHLLESLQGIYEVPLAYAQAIPADVASLLLLITGPGIQSPIQTTIDIASGRVTVNVPIGNDRVFEVRAFPAASSTSNFIGRTTANVSPNGTNVTVNMQAANLQPPIVINPGNQSTLEGASVTLQITVIGLNGLSLIYNAGGLPPGLSIDPPSCLISGTLPFTAAGTYPVTVTASDGLLTSSTASTWAVVNVNSHQWSPIRGT
jgi:hypothetical protein